MIAAGAPTAACCLDSVPPSTIRPPARPPRSENKQLRRAVQLLQEQLGKAESGLRRGQDRLSGLVQGEQQLGALLEAKREELAESQARVEALEAELETKE